MTIPARVLLVAPSAHVSSQVAATLRAAGYSLIVASEFIKAKALLDTRPDFLITEVKLGAYNGLHLAIRAAGQHTPTIVIGHTDPILQREAERAEAAFLTTPVDPERVLGLTRELLTASQTRRSRRKHVRVPDAFLNDVHARLLDVSYEGAITAGATTRVRCWRTAWANVGATTVSWRVKGNGTMTNSASQWS